MGLVSTTDKLEARETGKIYLDKEFYRRVNALKRFSIKKCEYCGNPIANNFDSSIDYHTKKYCDDWCRGENLKIIYKEKNAKKNKKV